MGDFIQKKERLRMKFLAIAFLMGAVSSFKISSKENLIKRFGESNVSFDPSLRTNYCNQCMEITVSSTGGTQEHQPNRLGRYTVARSLWDNMVPFWMSDNRQYITPDPNSNPMFYYIKWEISESVGGINAGVMNDAYTSGINCPYEIPDQWKYLFIAEWYVDPTLRFTCTKTRLQWEEEQTRQWISTAQSN